MGIERQKMIENLKRQAEFLNKAKENQEKNRELLREEESSSKQTGKTLQLRANPDIKFASEPTENHFERKNGYTSALMLGLLTFVFEMGFLFISYFIFR